MWNNGVWTKLEMKTSFFRKINETKENKFLNGIFYSYFLHDFSNIIQIWLLGVWISTSH